MSDATRTTAEKAFAAIWSPNPDIVAQSSTARQARLKVLARAARETAHEKNIDRQRQRRVQRDGG